MTVSIFLDRSTEEPLPSFSKRHRNDVPAVPRNPRKEERTTGERIGPKGRRAGLRTVEEEKNEAGGGGGARRSELCQITEVRDINDS